MLDGLANHGVGTSKQDVDPAPLQDSSGAPTNDIEQQTLEYGGTATPNGKWNLDSKGEPLGVGQKCIAKPPPWLQGWKDLGCNALKICL